MGWVSSKMSVCSCMGTGHARHFPILLHLGGTMWHVDTHKMWVKMTCITSGPEHLRSGCAFLCVYFPLSTGLKQMTKSLGGKKLSPWKPLITLIGWLDEWEINFYWVKPLRLWEIVGSITLLLSVLLIQSAWQMPPSHTVLSAWTKKRIGERTFPGIDMRD